MASPTLRSTNDGYAPPVKSTLQTHVDSTSRRVLGDVSPNTKSVTPAFMKKPMAGSPLKRSFTAAMEGSDGFTYLKKRKLSSHETLSHTDGSQDHHHEPSVPKIVEPIARGAPVIDIDQAATASEPTAELSPTEPNTPSDQDDSTQDSSAERKSFSSLINYDPSSQTTSNVVFKSVSKAEMLRLRLRVAMYKIQTNQVDVPFAELRVEGRGVPSLSGQNAVEEAVAALRKEALSVQARRPPPSIPKLLPAPVLRPTSYSSRMIYETNPPSSPPLSGSPERLPLAPPTRVSTPRRASRHLGSPSSSPDRFQGRQAEQELTSSVVKGRVAEGLLDLRHAIA